MRICKCLVYLHAQMVIIIFAVAQKVVVIAIIPRDHPHPSSEIQNPGFPGTTWNVITLIGKHKTKRRCPPFGGRKKSTQPPLHFFVTLTEVLKIAPEASQPWTVILCVPTLRGRKVSMVLALALAFQAPSI